MHGAAITAPHVGMAVTEDQQQLPTPVPLLGLDGHIIKPGHRAALATGSGPLAGAVQSLHGDVHLGSCVVLHQLDFTCKPELAGVNYHCSAPMLRRKPLPCCSICKAGSGPQAFLTSDKDAQSQSEVSLTGDPKGHQVVKKGSQHLRAKVKVCLLLAVLEVERHGQQLQVRVAHGTADELLDDHAVHDSTLLCTHAIVVGAMVLHPLVLSLHGHARCFSRGTKLENDLHVVQVAMELGGAPVGAGSHVMEGQLLRLGMLPEGGRGGGDENTY